MGNGSAGNGSAEAAAEIAASRRAAPLSARGVGKGFIGGDGSRLQILSGVDFELQSGEAVAVVGASGAGKSTLLHVLGALDRPTEGEIYVGEQAVSGLDDEALGAVRNRHIGFVFQFHHLLREFTALENVMMPALIAGTGFSPARERARELLRSVGVDHREDHKPRQLSGGEQQRVAVARALVNEPLVLLADEPTGNLDSQTSESLHALLFQLQAERALSMVIVTHNPELADQADRILEVSNGRLEPKLEG